MTNNQPKRPDLTREQAQSLTEQVRLHYDQASEVLVTLHDGNGHNGMGYPTWESYVIAELGWSLRRSYQVLKHGRVVRAFEEEFGASVNLSERAVREISDLASFIAVIKAQVTDSTDIGKLIVDVVEAHSRRMRAEKKVAREQKDQERRAIEARLAAEMADVERERHRRETSVEDLLGDTGGELRDPTVLTFESAILAGPVSADVANVADVLAGDELSASPYVYVPSKGNEVEGAVAAPEPKTVTLTWTRVADELVTSRPIRDETRGLEHRDVVRVVLSALTTELADHERYLLWRRVTALMPKKLIEEWIRNYRLGKT
jgi:hypothetical protein